MKSAPLRGRQQLQLHRWASSGKLHRARVGILPAGPRWHVKRNQGVKEKQRANKTKEAEADQREKMADLEAQKKLVLPYLQVRKRLRDIYVRYRGSMHGRLHQTGGGGAGMDADAPPRRAHPSLLLALSAPPAHSTPMAHPPPPCMHAACRGAAGRRSQSRLLLQAVGGGPGGPHGGFAAATTGMQLQDPTRPACMLT